MEIEEISNKITELARKRAESKGYELNEEICLIHIMEELGELSAELFSKKARPDKFDEENLKVEICDLILESLTLAKIKNIDLSKKLNEKIKEIASRIEKY